MPDTPQVPASWVVEKPSEKPSALQVIAGDAERIAAGFVPDVNKLPRIVGSLIKQVEQLAGGKLESLADEVLGITPDPVEAFSPGASVSALEAQMAAQAQTIKTLQAELAADRAPAAGTPSTGEDSET